MWGSQDTRSGELRIKATLESRKTSVYIAYFSSVSMCVGVCPESCDENKKKTGKTRAAFSVF